jgi:hypothetical protein
MLSWIIQITLISVVLIFLVHYLINFFKSTLTVPKIKDLVNSPTQKYESMYNVINQKPDPPMSSDNYTLIDLLPTKDIPTMKNELKDFLKNQLHSSTSSEPEVVALDQSIGDMNTFSTYQTI